MDLLHIGKSSLNPFMRNAVQKAVAQIQSGLGDVDNGWLSLPEPDPEDGALSIDNDAGEGSLSKTDE